MTTAPGLVATDLDGTLLRSDGTASPRTVAAVRAIQEAGIGFVVATARPPRWLHHLTDVLGDHGIAICSNGAFLYDVHNRVVLAEQSISHDVVASIVADLRAAIPGIAFARESADGYGREEHYAEQHPAPPDSPIGPVEGLAGGQPGKLLARAPHVDDDEFLERVAEVVGDRAIVSFSGGLGLAELSAAGVTKAAVLAEWCDDRGVDAAQVWAFGDMPNDLPMLAWAGRSFAVANAHPLVAEAATDRCGGNDDDGVAAVLEQVVRERAGAGR